MLILTFAGGKHLYYQQMSCKNNNIYKERKIIEHMGQTPYSVKLGDVPLGVQAQQHQASANFNR